MNNLSKNAKVSSALDYAEAATDRNGATLDMQGWDGVLMIVKFAAIAASAVTKIKAQQGEASDMSDAADLAGTGIDVADDDDNQIFMIDIYRPRERYVRLVVDKDTSHNTAESAIYIQYKGRKGPVDNNVANLVTAETHISPAEGTA